MRGPRVWVNSVGEDHSNEPSCCTVISPPSAIGRDEPGSASAGVLFLSPNPPSVLLVSVPNTLPRMTKRPSSLSWLAAVPMRVTPSASEVVSAVHQPDTANWSLSRSEEISRPAVGSVQIRTMISSATWVAIRPTLILRSHSGRPVVTRGIAALSTAVVISASPARHWPDGCSRS